MTYYYRVWGYDLLLEHIILVISRPINWMVLRETFYNRAQVFSKDNRNKGSQPYVSTIIGHIILEIVREKSGNFVSPEKWFYPGNFHNRACFCETIESKGSQPYVLNHIYT